MALPPVTPYDAALRVLHDLRQAGFESWLVGGCVRDHLLGQDPATMAEFDIATAARPDDVARVFRRTVAVGRAFGVMRVGVTRDQWVEVATFRTERDYQDGRHPSEVRFATAEEDVRRRDFTVNGLLWDPITGEVRDHVGGREDLERRRIRAIGDPDERLAEDALRLLRAVRFAAMDGFDLDPGTEAAVHRQRDRLRLVSSERIREELAKIATRPGNRRGDAWRLLVRTGLATVAVDGASEDTGQSEADGAVMDRLGARSLPLFLAVVLRHAEPAGAPPSRWRSRAERVVAALRGSAEESAQLAEILASRGRYRGFDGLPQSRRVLLATRADRDLHEDLLQAEGDAPAVLRALQELRQTHGPDRPAPLLDGRMLLARGLQPGPALGRILRKVRILQLAGRLATADDALRYLGR